MDLPELQRRLRPFVRAQYDDPGATVSDVYNMPGHAGFSYGFSATSQDKTESWYLRLPPPNVNWKGTADVLRQVTALNALDSTAVPHCRVKWSGDDLDWFGCPYFVVPKLEGDVFRQEEGAWGRELDQETRWSMARQVMTALAGAHKVDWESKCRYLGDPVPFDEDVIRWDKFVGRAAEPAMMVHQPALREKLLATIPEDAPVGLFHGDFQWSNVFFSFEGKLLAVIDWELTGVGATLNDVGWMATFNDPPAWSDPGRVSGLMPGAEELVDMYATAYGDTLPNLNWFRALAAYKFSIITGLNLYLHRSGKRPDPTWEDTGPSAKTLMARALELLG